MEIVALNGGRIESVVSYASLSSLPELGSYWVKDESEFVVSEAPRPTGLE